MANPYYTFSTRAISGARVRSADFNANFDQVESAFDNFPSVVRDFNSGGTVFAGELAHSGNAYAATTKNPRSTIEAGDVVVFIVPEGGNNTGAATLSVDNSAAIPLVRHDGTVLRGDDLTTGLVYYVVYNAGGDTGGSVAARWQMMAMPVGIAGETEAYRSSAAGSADEAATSATAADGSAIAAEGSAIAAAASVAEAASAEELGFDADGTLPLTKGGTGAISAAAARTSLGLGSAAQKDTGVNIGDVPVVESTGLLNSAIIPATGSISLGALPVIAIAKGGTGATSATAARTNLGLGSAAQQDTGTASGDVPLLTTGGVLATARIPNISADKLTSGSIATARLPIIPTVKGGTGASTVAGARTNLGLGSAAVVNTGTDSGNLVTLSAGGVFAITRIPNLAASKITSGAFAADRIPNLAASKITSGTLGTDRIPNLSAAKINAGELSINRIPGLAASKITSGSFVTDRIPNLSADKINTGTLGVNRIPDISANKITSDTLGVTRIPNLSANKITSDTLGVDRIPVLSTGKIPNLSANKITSGTLNINRIPDLTASKITSGAFATTRIPNLSANKITTDTLGTDRIPSLNASKITAGTLGVDRIPSLSASKITTDTLGADRIPSLSANKITTDTLGTDRIPSLNASKITAGTLGVDRIPSLNANKITSGTLNIARIADNAVTLAKMVHGTAGRVIGYNSSGEPAEITVSPIKRIQRISTTLAGTDNDVKDVTITAVDTSKTVVIMNTVIGNIGRNTVQLENSTTVRYISDAVGANNILHCTVVEYN